MSHATGMCRFDSDGLILFFDYNGTVDVCVSNLLDDYNEMWDKTREHEWLNCTDGKDEPCTLFTDYGNGFYWKGRACRYCRAITEETNPFEPADDELKTTRGVPKWAEESYPKEKQ